jgi:GTP pyrophosphokinase
MYVIDREMEEKDIQRKYDELIELCKNKISISTEEENTIYRAFSISKKAHASMRRKSGEPYIYHPLSVAQIAVKEIGLGSTGVVCSLLHDVVEDTDTTLEDIRMIFGDRVTKIIDGLTKIDNIFDSQTNSIQAENFKKILLAMADDVYVIFLKLCDRLHNMRTLNHMPEAKQLIISSETQYLYIPIAHRLGLYTIKTELEELVMKYTNPQAYNHIKEMIELSESDRESFIEDFSKSIRDILDKRGYKYVLNGRIKSIYSIWRKMEKKRIDFEEIYDIFAIRIIIDVPQEIEKEECFKIYSLITSLFRPNPERFRDWVTTPKANGYESIHTTVMSPAGRWVEVQIRSKRMDDIAEKGMAAHFLYKEGLSENDVQSEVADNWLTQIRETLENTETNALDFVDYFKQSLYTKEIYLFTPKGKMITLPAGSTVLDFAFAIHTQLGLTCMGAKVNSQVVSNKQVLKSGEQVQILSSRKISPEEHWIDIAKTQRAKGEIKKYFRTQKRKYELEGKNKLTKILQSLNYEITSSILGEIRSTLGLHNDLDLFYQVAKDQIGEKEIRKCFNKNYKPKRTPWLMLASPFKYLFRPITAATSPKQSRVDTNMDEKVKINIGNILLDEKYENYEIEIAKCCNPLQGDDVIGFIEDNKIVVHRTSCEKAIDLLATQKNRVVKAKWRKGEAVSFLAGIQIVAIDRKGLLQDLTRVISEEMDLNIRGITLETSQGIVNGIIMMYINDTESLNGLMKKIQKLEGIESVRRI